MLFNNVIINYKEGVVMCDLRYRLIESIIHSVIIMILGLMEMIFVVKYISVSLLLIVSIIGILFILFYLKKKNNHDKNKLITYSWISMIFIIFIGALL